MNNSLLSYLKSDIEILESIDPMNSPAAHPLSAGWNGDERVVRFTYAAVAALQFGLIAGRLLNLVRNESRYNWLEQRFGGTFDEIISDRERSPLLMH